MYIDNYIPQVRELCKKHGVKYLYVFGSVLTEKFSKQSDIDMLVEIESDGPFDYADKYFDLKFGLQQLFQRPVDLLEDRALNNEYLKESINKSKYVLYAA